MNESISALEEERDALKEQVARLTAPVSDEEWDAALRNHASPRSVFNSLITARASKEEKA